MAERDAAPAVCFANSHRDASGGRPLTLRWAAGSPAGRGLDEGGRKPAGSGCAGRICRRPGRTAPKRKIAADDAPGGGCAVKAVQHHKD